MDILYPFINDVNWVFDAVYFVKKVVHKSNYTLISAHNKYKMTSGMEKILISACLVGDKTRFDGHSNYTPLIEKLLEKYELVPFCPEVEGGLKTPRDPSEIKGEKVVSSKGRDVTRFFNEGAEKALNICKYLSIKIAILKESSPSCGVHEIHDGSFQNKKIKGEGITTSLLKKNGIRVINEKEIESFLEETDK